MKGMFLATLELLVFDPDAQQTVSLPGDIWAGVDRHLDRRRHRASQGRCRNRRTGSDGVRAGLTRSASIPNEVEKRAGIDRLRQDLVATWSQLRRSRHDRDGNRRKPWIAAKVLDQLLADDAGHEQVHDHRARRLRMLQGVDRLDPVGRDMDVVPLAREQLGECLLDIGIVVDNEDPWLRGHSIPACRTVFRWQRALARAAFARTFVLMSDPVRDLAHDHADLNRRVLALAAAFGTCSRTPDASAESLAPKLVELRETLFLHFVREEEGLFPFMWTWPRSSSRRSAR